MPMFTPMSTLVQPERIEEPGLLVGWSREFTRRRPPMGFNYGHPLKTPDTGYLDPILLHGDGHLISIAPTGAGKGTGCIVPALLRYPGPVIVIDPKGENVAITARRRREMGHRVVVIDPMGITDEARDAFNPLDVIDITQAGAVDDVVSMAQTLVASVDSDSRSRYWVQRGMHLVCGVMLEVLQQAADARKAGRPGAHAHLLQVRQIINDAAADPAKIAALLGASRHPEVQRIGSLLNIGAPETLGGILSFAQEAVDFLRGDQIQDCLDASSFDVDDVTSGAPLSIYLVLPPHMLESHGRLLRLWLAALCTCVTRRRGRPAMSTLFILDEAAQLGELSQLRQAVTLLRGYGLQTWSFWQDVSQLQMLYPRDWKTMVNNCRVLQCFGALNQVAADDMAQLTGFGDGKAVLDLETDEMLLQVGGEEAVVAQLPDYRTDPAFAGQFDPNPFHDVNRDVMPKKSVPQRLYERPHPKKGVAQAASSADAESSDGVPAYAVLSEHDSLFKRLLEKWRDSSEARS